MTTELPIHWLKEPSKTAWSNCTNKLTKVALPEPRRALLPSWQYEPRLFPNTGEVLKRSHFHRWWPYRNHLQLVSLHRPQLNILIDQKMGTDRQSISRTLKPRCLDAELPSSR